MDAPTPDDVRQALAHLDARRQKIVVGLVGVMIQNPGSVRDREWIARKLTEVVVVAWPDESDEEQAPEAQVELVQDFLRESSADLLGAAFLLFQRVGLDLRDRAADGFTFDEALRRALAYLPPPDAAPDGSTA